MFLRSSETLKFQLSNPNSFEMIGKQTEWLRQKKQKKTVLRATWHRVTLALIHFCEQRPVGLLSLNSFPSSKLNTAKTHAIYLEQADGGFKVTAWQKKQKHKNRLLWTKMALRAHGKQSTARGTQ